MILYPTKTKVASRSILLLLLLMPFTLPVYSQNNTDTINSKQQKSITEAAQPLKEVVITGDIRNRVIIPAMVLSSKELQALNSFSVADAIRYFAGLQLKDYGGIGGLKTVNIRSMGTYAMGVFYDGIQLGNAQNGQIDLGRFSLDNVESISLYNGQKSEIFQSARDFGASGTIYITTRKPKFEEGKDANMKVSLRTGSFNLLNPSLLYEYKISNNISSSFSGEWINSDGKYNFRYQRRNTLGEVLYDTTAVRQNGDINATRMEAGLHGIIRDGRWTVRAYTFNSERGIPGAIVNNTFREGERLWDTNSFLQGTFTKSFGEKYSLLLNTKYAADYTLYENKDYVLVRVKNKYKQKEFYLSSANLYSINDHWDVSLAYDFQWNKLDAEFYMPNAEDNFPYPTRYTHMIAAASVFELHRLKVQGSFMGYLMNEKVKQYRASPDKSIFTPSVFMSYQPIEKHQLSLRAFYKQLFRMPTFNDLYYTEMGNAFLKPEYETRYNVGIKYTKDLKWGIWQLFDVQVDAYYSEVTDKIISYPKGQQFRWKTINLGEVEIKGIDASIRNDFAIDEVLITSKLQYTYQKAQDFSDPTDTYYGDQIPYIPWHSGSVVANMYYKGWGLNYSFIYTGERYNQQENIPNNHTEPWYTSDLGVVKNFVLGGAKKKTMKVSLEVNNLMSQDYDIILNYPMPKRNYKLLVSIDL